MSAAKIGRLARTSALLQRNWQNAQPRLNKMWHYAKIELAPPSPAEIMQIPGLLSKSVSNGLGNVTTKTLLMRSLVCCEFLVLFYLGEMIGKKNIIGYRKVFPQDKDTKFELDESLLAK